MPVSSSFSSSSSFLSFQYRVSLYSSAWPRIHSIYEAGLELTDITAFASQVVGVLLSVIAAQF